MYRFLSSENISKKSPSVNNGYEILFSAGPVQNESQKSKLSSEELLEKSIAHLSTDIYQKNRVYKNDLIRVINKVKELNLSSKRQGLLLLKCCTELLPDETPGSRMDLVEQVWNIIK